MGVEKFGVYMGQGDVPYETLLILHFRTKIN